MSTFLRFCFCSVQQTPADPVDVMCLKGTFKCEAFYHQNVHRHIHAEFTHTLRATGPATPVPGRMFGSGLESVPKNDSPVPRFHAGVPTPGAASRHQSPRTDDSSDPMRKWSQHSNAMSGYATGSFPDQPGNNTPLAGHEKTVQNKPAVAHKTAITTLWNVTTLVRLRLFTGSQSLFLRFDAPVHPRR